MTRLEINVLFFIYLSFYLPIYLSVYLYLSTKLSIPILLNIFQTLTLYILIIPNPLYWRLESNTVRS